MTFARYTRLMAINRKISSNDPNALNDPNDPCLSNSLTIKEIPPLRLVEEGILYSFRNIYNAFSNILQRKVMNYFLICAKICVFFIQKK